MLSIFFEDILTSMRKNQAIGFIAFIGFCLFNFMDDYMYRWLGGLMMMYFVKVFFSITFVDVLFRPLLECIIRGMTAARKEIVVAYKDILLAKPLSLKSISDHVLKHRAGLVASIRSITKARDADDIISETIKIGSMLGVEDTIANNLMSIGTGKIIDVVSNTNSDILSQNALEDVVPLVATIATIAGKEIADIDVSNFLVKQANNIKAIETLTKHVKGSLEQMGVIKSPNYSIVIEISEKIAQMREDILYCEVLLRTNASEFAKPEAANKLITLKKFAIECETKMKLITSAECRQHQSLTEISKIIATIYDIDKQVEIIKKGFNTRVEPVGVCIRGEKQIGKSTLIPILFSKINKIIKESDIYRPHFTNPDDWTSWHVQSRDEFDTGYVGQEYTYADDGFQDKETKDHLKWINFISPEPVGTVQADIRSKGHPFISKVCAVTCNVWPQVSTTINCIQALHERFPVSIDVRVKPGHRVPSSGDFDSSFSWLEFRVTTMSKHISSVETIPVLTLDEIAAIIAQKMYYKETLYQNKLRFLSTQRQNADDDEIEILNEVDREVVAALPMNDVNVDNFLDDQVINDGYILRNIKGYITEKREYAYAIKAKAYMTVKELIRNPVNCTYSALYKALRLAMTGSPDEFIDTSRISIDLATEFLTISAIDTLMDQLPRQVLSNMNSVRSQNITSLNDLEDWVYYIRDKTTGKTLAQMRDEGNDISVDTLLYSLGCYEYIPENKQEFINAWSRQKIIRLYSETLTCHVYWGPMLKHGRALLPESDVVLNVLRQQPQDNKPCYRFLHNILGFGISSGLSMIVPTSYLGYVMFYKIVTMQGFASNVSKGRTLFGRFVDVVRSRDYYMIDRVYAFTKLVDPTIIFSSILAKSFSYIESLNRRLSDYSLGVVITLLESIGIPVSKYWEEILTTVIDTTIQFSLVTLACIIVTILYRWLTKVQVKDNTKPKILVVNSKGEKKVKRKVVNRKVNRVKISQNANEDDSDDEDYEEIPFNHEFSGESVVDVLRIISNHNDRIIVGNVNNDIMSIVVKDNEPFTIPIVEGNYNNTVTKYCSNNFTDSETNQTCLGIEYEFEFASNKKEFKDMFNALISMFLDYKPKGYDFEIQISYLEDIIFFKCSINCYKISKLDKIVSITRQDVKSIKSIYDDYKGLTKKVNYKVSDVIENKVLSLRENCDGNAITNIKHYINAHKVMISILNIKDFDNGIRGSVQYGIGSTKFIILNAHAINDKQIIKYWRPINKDTNTYRNYGIAEVIFVDTLRDLCICKIISKKLAIEKYKYMFKYSLKIEDTFPNISKHLLYTTQWVNACINAHVICDLPCSDILTTGQITYFGAKDYMFEDSQCKPREIMEINLFDNSTHLVSKGDCGGLVVITSGKYTGRIIGFHAASSKNHWYGAVLTIEDFNDLNIDKLQENCFEDSWDSLIVPGEAEDLPNGTEVLYCGKFLVKTLPASNTSLSHWHYSPFADEFEEQLAPGPLSPTDSRIIVDVLENNVGRKSLLMEPNSAMAKQLPSLNSKHLDWIEDQLVDELSINMMDILDTVEDNVDDLMITALNGKSSWNFVHGIDTSKAAGLPWCYYDANQKKDLIHMDDDGFRTFQNDHKGSALKDRVRNKLLLAKSGKRMISFSNSKLKDAVIKLDYVKQGRTRIFHCVPVDSIICDAALFGPFKEAYSSLGLKAYHAVGTNPHSVQWKKIYDYLKKHPNYFDLDFKNYDKYLHREVMLCVFSIIRRVIAKVSPDNWDEARRVQMMENIETYVVDYQTVYKTNRGNKSGSYLTTIINCLANDIYSIYTWLETVQVKSLKVFRDNVSEVSFGDDKLESVSDVYANRYNYLTAKVVMERIGHTITPGSKDGIEKAFTEMENLQFLKRGFFFHEGYVYAPLLQRSIESPFVWTQLLDTDYIIWENLVKEQMFEAILHGKLYYDDFMIKLKKCDNIALLQHLNPLLNNTYEYTWEEYKHRYFNDNGKFT